MFETLMSRRVGPLGGWPIGIQWASLAALSLLFAGLLELLHLPAALLLGPMAAGIVVAAGGGRVRVPALPFAAAQAVIGCLIARTIRPPIFLEVAREWPLFVAVIVSVIAVSSSLGWLLTRWRVLPGSTAVWGSAPGAAAAMTLLAEAFGADIRLVAFMQYLRVVFVAVAASAVARLWAAHAGGPPPPVIWFPHIDWIPFSETLTLAAFCTLVAHRLKVAALPLLLPLGLGVMLQDTGMMTIELPQWLLAGSYAVLGWGIGLRFTRPILVHAARALPRVVASILTLIVICGGLAAGLVAGAHIDPLTAYLATSPGGVDSVAVIAASSKVDMPFVMAMQTARFIVVLLAGPAIARFVANLTGAVDEPAF